MKAPAVHSATLRILKLNLYDATSLGIVCEQLTELCVDGRSLSTLHITAPKLSGLDASTLVKLRALQLDCCSLTRLRLSKSSPVLLEPDQLKIRAPRLTEVVGVGRDATELILRLAREST